MTQHTSNQASSFNQRPPTSATGGPFPRPPEQYYMQSVSPFNHKHMNSGNRQNYGVSRFIRRGATPHEQQPNPYMSAQYMMYGNQNSQRKVLRSAMNEPSRPSAFGITPPGSQKQKNILRPTTNSDNMDGIDGEMPQQYQMVRPFESQHKDVYHSGYESYEPFKMPMIYKS